MRWIRKMKNIQLEEYLNFKNTIMKFFYCILLTMIGGSVYGQADIKNQYEKELESISAKMEQRVNAKFGKGPFFTFNEPYKAVFTEAMSYSTGSSSNRVSKEFQVGDSILIVGCAPAGPAKKFKAMDSDALYDTKLFGKSGYTILQKEKMRDQVAMVRTTEWRRAEKLRDMLSCGMFDEIGKMNFEKHWIDFGDTPLFYQVRLEEGKTLLYTMLRTFGGNDFKDVGAAIAEQSFVEFNFLDGSTLKLNCMGEGTSEQFAIVDITDHKAKFQSGVEQITYSLEKKKVSQKLEDENRYSIGFKMDCMKL